MKGVYYESIKLSVCWNLINAYRCIAIPSWKSSLVVAYPTTRWRHLDSTIFLPAQSQIFALRLIWRKLMHIDPWILTRMLHICTQSIICDQSTCSYSHALITMIQFIVSRQSLFESIYDVTLIRYNHLHDTSKADLKCWIRNVNKDGANSASLSHIGASTVERKEKETAVSAARCEEVNHWRVGKSWTYE